MNCPARELMSQRDKAIGPISLEPDAYRVFVSYSHDERSIAEQIIAILREQGLQPIWDRNFALGHGFHDQIKNCIAHAHVFVPIITNASINRGWVHQEIGFALGQNIPVLPVCFEQPQKGPKRIRASTKSNSEQQINETTPGQFLQQLHAVELHEPIADCRELFDHSVFANLVDRFADPSIAQYSCSEHREERAMMMSGFAEEAWLAQISSGLRAGGHVRQRGALSSFHIPAEVITDSIWRKRYARDSDVHDKGIIELRKDIEKTRDFFDFGGPTPFHRKMQRQERLSLQKHAEASGFSLIVNPYLPIHGLSATARISRLECLVSFLESMKSVDIPKTVAIDSEMHDTVNTTMVGNWFVAESVTMEGPRQTNFTTHAPSIETRKALFDIEIRRLLRDREWSAESSIYNAIEEVNEIVSELRASLRKIRSNRATQKGRTPTKKKVAKRRT